MSKSREGRGPGGGKRPPVGERRRRSIARQLGIDPENKALLDAMHERSQERFGVGIGVVVQEEQRLRLEAKGHHAERERITGVRRAVQVAGWPFSHYHRLRRMEREATERAAEWERRMRVIALDVARHADNETVNAALARGVGER